MNEELEKAKDKYNVAIKIGKKYNNPIAKQLIAYIPLISTAIDSSLQLMIEKHQEKKLDELFNIILADDKITQEDVNNIDHIMEFRKTLEVINHLIRNDKVKYFAYLLKNTIISKEDNVDFFEEWLNRIDSLSCREIDILIYMYEFEKKIPNTENGEKQLWDDFVINASEKFGIDKNTITSLVSGMTRTGFCNVKDIMYPGSSAKVYYLSDYFKQNVNKIME